MNLTLRDARRLEKQLEAAVNTLRGSLVTSKRVTVFEAPVDQSLFDLGRGDLEKQLVEAGELITLRYAVRDRIRAANNAGEITAAMLEIAQLEQRLSFVNALAGARTQAYDPYNRHNQDQAIEAETTLATINAQLASAKKAYEANGTGTPSVTVQFLTKADRESYSKQSAQLNKQLTTLRDKLAAKNATASIDLPLTAEQKKLLEKHNVLVG